MNQLNGTYTNSTLLVSNISVATFINNNNNITVTPLNYSSPIFGGVYEFQ